jgi:hypothetical protein
MLARSSLMTVTAGLVLATGLSACGAEPTQAQRSLAMIHVRMYQRIGQLNQTWPSGTVSIGAYFGPIVGDRDLTRTINGPGVAVLPLARTSGLDPGTYLIGRGKAPLGCKLIAERFVGSAQPSSWFGASLSQLRQVRLGEADILLVTAVCGSG